MADIPSDEVILFFGRCSHLNRKDALLATGAYALVLSLGREIDNPEDLARVCHLDIRTARRLWPAVEHGI